MPQGGVWGGTYDPGPYAQAAALAAHSCGSCTMEKTILLLFVTSQLDISAL